MKKLILLIISLVFLIACSNSGNKTHVKLNLPDSLTEDQSSPKAQTDTIHHITPLIGTSKPLTKKQKLHNINMQRARTAFNNAIKAYNSHKFDQAAESFKESLGYDPNNNLACYNLGKIYFDQGQKNLALSYFEDAVNINPKDTASMISAGLVYFEKNNFDKAKQYYDKALKIAPHYGKAYFHRGTLLGTHKHYKQSVADLEKAVKYEKDNSEAYVNLGLAYYYLKDMKKACKAWHRAAAMGNTKGQTAVNAYCKTK